MGRPIIARGEGPLRAAIPGKLRIEVPSPKGAAEKSEFAETISVGSEKADNAELG